ncbi:MAG: hydroxyacid dehydrogenase [Bordetella sp. SCN 67-23]|nr:FAD-binding oxidoreductase [Burkholderiales bacterium]ODS72575.1 MAG: hydroxyacid dehydrogenase [Bordetella sp. SCN 67-23]ODU67776.1 MAG: hydroxyacid dehydrogenase [Bordetella sp. SCN 68-11]OJW94667.1 MAG: hydroxyacid dehydrogenase [Burkholderiales bacterium 67-32]
MSMHSDPLVAELAAIVGEPHVLTAAGDTARYCSDWRGRYPGIARAVVRPAGTAEVARVVAACAAHGAAVVPQGGNTGLVGGSTPDDSGAEIVLSLERLSRVRRVDPLDNSMTLEAGCTVLAAQEAAAVHGKLFPLALASQGTATIGGVVSTNAGGEQVVRYGNTRELTLGVEVVLADGSVLDVLTPLRKDNTGYDLKQLFIGGEGTLGIVTAATFKLFSAPRKAITAWASVPDPQAAVGLLACLTDAVGERVTAFELINREALDQVLAHPLDGMRDPLQGRYPWAVLMEISETSGAIDPTPAVEGALEAAMEGGLVADAVLAASSRQAEELWSLRNHVPEAQRAQGHSIKHDISVSISRIPEFIARADAALAARVPGIRLVCFGHVGDGNLHYNQSRPSGMSDATFRAVEDEVHACVHAVVAALQGSVSAEHGIGRLKQEAFLQYKPAVAVALMRRIKHALDPASLFNPGRLLPRPSSTH